MNFYKHYIGDFQRDTNHLSLTERGAYLALMHHYYATEKPLPKNIDALCRIAGAVTKLERAAVVVAMNFFEPVESGLMHSRIEAELEKAGEISSTNRNIALAREAKRRASRTAEQDHKESTIRAHGVPRSTHERSTNHTPDSRLPDLKPAVIHTESITPNTSPEEPEPACVIPLKPGTAGAYCQILIAKGIRGCSPTNPTLLVLLEAGACKEEFLEAARLAKESGNPKFGYVLGIVRKQREDAAKLVLYKGRLPNKQELIEQSNKAATAGWLPPELREMKNAN